MTQCEHHLQEEKNVKKLCISLVPIFNHLQNDEMLQIAEKSRHTSYQKGETVFEDGDSSDHLYIVHQGQVKIYRLSESGKEQLIRILEPGDFMGELSLFTDETLTSYAEAMKKTEICVIHKSDLRGIILAKPVIALKILETFSKRLNEAEKTIERFSSQDAEKRIASYLIDLSNSLTVTPSFDEPFEVNLPMSKKDLASYIGMTQETLSRRLSSFQELGWIGQTGQRNLKILDYEAILEAARE
ncbi:Crp/Fnr family transcriptional regulator [Bacillus sp. CECT 9360]|uniref:Crp/Fnr family transcriptional regulator n=1 Tax=Bacillus sp. CECT 9360 TaxID=2845821 RepID=UPI001E2B4D5A|nr:Crp/Fnr family transcriptional regulator [Bacillus sp. CECT 9360]CAH0345790.1 CRP-like cAMP-activated global transcriptional regulator [Bacillus sp. CECT 9360]